MSISGTSAEHPPHMTLQRKVCPVLNFQGFFDCSISTENTFQYVKVIFLRSIYVIVLKPNKCNCSGFFIDEKCSLITLWGFQIAVPSAL